jgi:DNA-binding transcriptional ArsR family regulator
VSIIQLLKDGPKKVTEIAKHLGMSQPAVSQNLKVLKAGGLVADQKDGYWVSYSLNGLRMLELRRELELVCRCHNADCEKTLEAYKDTIEQELVWINEQLASLTADVR